MVMKPFVFQHAQDVWLCWRCFPGAAVTASVRPGSCGAAGRGLVVMRRGDKECGRAEQWEDCQRDGTNQ